MVKAIEDYYNGSQNNYSIILCSTMKRSNYEPRILAENGKFDTYALLSPRKYIDGIPHYEKTSMLYIGYHEFSHSFINPLTESNPEKIMASEKLFEPIKSFMGKHAYGNWEICVNEHVVRAVVIRLIGSEMGAEIAEMATKEEESFHFVYIRPIIKKLKEYEELRKKDNITFAEYFPTLLDALADMEPYKP